MINNKLNITNFLDVVEIDGNIEWDLLNKNWELFQINNPITLHPVTLFEVQRPDFISFRVYGDSQYWWVLCKFNNIDDIWNDMKLDDVLLVPNLNDINDFYNRVRMRNK